MGKKKDLTGQKFGRLTALSYSHQNHLGVSYWKFRCDCGNEITTAGAQVVRGHATSCGCRQREAAAANNLSHGKTNTPTYRIWLNMRTRCLNPSRKQWKDWGGRGISFDPLWNDFSVFLADMGERPEGLSLERKDNSKNYSKDNCVWATAKQQCRNTRRNRRITIGGATKLLCEWEETSGIDADCITKRIEILKWPESRWLEPTQKRTKK